MSVPALDLAVPCPACGGGGRRTDTAVVRLPGGRSMTLGPRPCNRCRATGRVGAAAARMMAAGAAIRAARRARGESVRGCARRLGTTSHLLNLIENGRAAADLHRWPDECLAVLDATPPGSAPSAPTAAGDARREAAAA